MFKTKVWRKREEDKELEESRVEDDSHLLLWRKSKIRCVNPHTKKTLKYH